MWWGRSERAAQAWVGGRRIAWCSADGHISTHPIGGADEAAALLRQRMVDERPKALQLWLGSAVCRLERVPAIEGVRSRTEAQSAMRALLHSRSLLADGAQAQLPYWPYEKSHWCVATFDGDLLQRLQGAVGKALKSIRPWWGWALDDARSAWSSEASSKGAAVTWALFDGEALTTATLNAAGELTEAGTVAPVVDAAAAQRILNRRFAGSGEQPAMPVRCWSLGHSLAEGKVRETTATSGDGVAAVFAFRDLLTHGDAF